MTTHCFVRGHAIAAHQDACAARENFTVVKVVGGRTAVVARSQELFFFSVFKLESVVEDIERAFPQTFVAVGLGVTNDSALNLVDLFEPAILHDD